MDVRSRLDELLPEHPYLRLYALVDGLAYKDHKGEALTYSSGRSALFDGTEDQALAPAGPWLIDAEKEPELCDSLAADPIASEFASWLISSAPFAGLAQLLQLRLDVQLPGGQTALLRFFDPRVLKSLALTLTPAQRSEFFEHITEWHFTCEGQDLRIGRADA